jgi:hypothetical protein
MATGAALNAAGADQKKLPSPLRRWLGTDGAEAARRKKQQAEHASLPGLSSRNAALIQVLDED